VQTDAPRGDDDDRYAAMRDYLIDRYRLIYPSDEAFDTHIGGLVKIQHVRIRFGTRPVTMWLRSEKKTVIARDRVVFDPAGKYDAETHVNLFRGLDVPPAAGDCTKLLGLLQFLCGEAGQDLAPVTEWVLKWTAFPLQHVGAKMQTAIVMHGEEGAGKNLFWGAVSDIYGDHGGTITQMQLESQFNDWLSAKLFLVANEVVTSAHRRSHVGLLKNLITEPRVWVNPKNLAARYEANHANLVFLSNELQPLQIGIRDRRYMVIHTPDALDRDYYAAAAAEARAGGIAALHQYLLDLNLGDFTPHTKPIITEARNALIEIGLSAPQLFWQELKGGELGLPYTPALVEDVYKAFRAWCERNGEKMPQRINLFVPAFMSMNGVRRVKDRVPDPDLGVRGLVAAADAEGAKLKQRRIFIMGERDSDPDAERIRIRRGIAEFRNAMRDYIGTGRSGHDGGHGRGESQGAF
jgi:putative DNA primase/helicase